MDLSETAFFVRTGPGQYHLRWFTPAIEVELCGHATLASRVHALHGSRRGRRVRHVRFAQRTAPGDARRGRLEMDFPAQPAAAAEAPAALVRALGREPEFCGRAGHPLALRLRRRPPTCATLQPDYALPRPGQTRPDDSSPPPAGTIAISSPGSSRPTPASPRIPSPARPIARSRRIGPPAWAGRACTRGRCPPGGASSGANRAAIG